jgi:hypothetical protein
MDGITAVAFHAGGQQVTVPVKDNLWYYAGEKLEKLIAAVGEMDCLGVRRRARRTRELSLSGSSVGNPLSSSCRGSGDDTAETLLRLASPQNAKRSFTLPKRCCGSNALPWQA